MSQYGASQYGNSQYGNSNRRVGHVASFSFSVAEILAFNQAPTARTVFNQFDEHGLLVSLRRNQEESNWAFKRRIQDVFVHRANASYRGLINGITRELGLEFFYPLTINPIRHGTGGFVAPDPYILFDGAHLYLYSDYANGLLDYKIDRLQPGGNYEHVGDLVHLINQTAFFEAFTLEGHRFTKSMTVVNQSNRVAIRNEDVPESTRFKLRNSYAVRGSVSFSDRQLFRREVSTTSEVTAAGLYHIDYTQAIVTVHSVPYPGVTVNYEHSVYPFKPIASPVILHNINDDNFRIKMFSQVLREDGTYVHGVPTEIGIDIINELCSVKSMYFGI